VANRDIGSKHNGPIKCSELDHGSEKRNPQSNGRKAKRGKIHASLAMIGSCFAPDWLNNEHAAYFDWVSTKCDRENIILSLFEGLMGLLKTN